MPSFSSKPIAPYLLYSKKYGLISIGDHSSDPKPFQILEFKEDGNFQTEWECQDVDLKWGEERSSLSAGFITDDKMMCCGGLNHEKYTDVYDFTEQSMTKLADMNEEREYSGICVETRFHDRVYIGGGANAPKKVEYYSIRKNEWLSLPDTNGNHRTWPIIWNDGANVINIASIDDCKLFEKIDIRENKWDVYISDANNAFDNLFATQIDINDWNSRLLIANGI